MEKIAWNIEVIIGAQNAKFICIYFYFNEKKFTNFFRMIKWRSMKVFVFVNGYSQTLYI